MMLDLRSEVLIAKDTDMFTTGMYHFCYNHNNYKGITKRNKSSKSKSPKSFRRLSEH